MEEGEREEGQTQLCQSKGVIRRKCGYSLWRLYKIPKIGGGVKKDALAMRRWDFEESSMKTIEKGMM